MTELDSAVHLGFGTLTERDGACYEGEFHGNRRHGEGFQVYANGDQYKGDWVKGQRHGHGVLRCSNGTTYEVCMTLQHNLMFMKWTVVHNIYVTILQSTKIR